MDRRTFLGVAGIGIATLGVATVYGTDVLDTREDTTNNQATTPSVTPYKIKNLDRVTYDSLSGFELTLSHQEIQIGETLTASLVNVKDEENSCGTKSKYLIQRKRGETWDSIYKQNGLVVWPSAAVAQQPGSGFTWEIPIQSSGIDHSKEALSPIGPIEPGRYRFVYFGVSSLSQEYDGIAKQFEITGN